MKGCSRQDRGFTLKVLCLDFLRGKQLLIPGHFKPRGAKAAKKGFKRKAEVLKDLSACIGVKRRLNEVKGFCLFPGHSKTQQVN